MFLFQSSGKIPIFLPRTSVKCRSDFLETPKKATKKLKNQSIVRQDLLKQMNNETQLEIDRHIEPDDLEKEISEIKEFVEKDLKKRNV